MSRMAPERALLSPNYHTTPTGGRLSSRQILRASLPYTAGLQWYWDRAHDTPATTKREFGDGPRNFEPRSSENDDTYELAGILFYFTQAGGSWSPDIFSGPFSVASLQDF
ncbi:UNVERIFIED_CONTAM: hypothetical protein NCL1_34362 [Trichonephila clavipes]